MPMYMCDEAVAAGTARPAAAARVAASTHTGLDTYRLPTVGRQHAAQPLLELDLGLPPEDLPRAGDLRLAHLRIVDRQGFVDDLALRAGQLHHGVGELEDRELLRGAEVHGQVLVALGEQGEPADAVVHVTGAARL